MLFVGCRFSIRRPPEKPQAGQRRGGEHHPLQRRHGLLQAEPLGAGYGALAPNAQAGGGVPGFRGSKTPLGLGGVFFGFELGAGAFFV